MKRILTVVSIVFILASNAAAKEYVMVFGASYPPFYWMSQTDTTEAKGHGMFIDLLQAFRKEHPEIDLRMVSLPRKRMDAWIDDGRAQAFSLSSPLFFTPRERQNYAFSPTIWTTSDHLVVPRDSKISSTDLEGLRGKTIGFLHGNDYSYLDTAAEEGLFRQYYAIYSHTLLQMMHHGRLDAVVINRHSLPYHLRRAGLGKEDVRVLPDPLYEFDLSILVQKNQQRLLDKLDRFILESRRNGLLKKLEREWDTFGYTITAPKQTANHIVEK
jgi:ABC-type amino acid transport substrate-binding protein